MLYLPGFNMKAHESYNAVSGRQPLASVSAYASSGKGL
jgi:hypothetical protein